jgi:Bifunctional DNA primase/polymerase, N-terminal
MYIPDTINELGMAEAFQLYRDRLRWHVYPVDSPQDEKSDFPGKKPSIRAWWNHSPNQWDVDKFFGKTGHTHNIGVAPRDGVQFIDLDSKQDQGASVRAWLSAHPELGGIPRHDRRNGCHLIVRCPDLPEWKKSATGRPCYEPVQANLSEHVSAALYHSSHTNVVLPPSVHRDGGTYSWSVCGDIPEVSWGMVAEKLRVQAAEGSA